MSDSRISVYIDVGTWVLVLLKVSSDDEGTYECHVNSDPTKKLAIHLIKVLVFNHLIFLNLLLSSNNESDGRVWAAPQ